MATTDNRQSGSDLPQFQPGVRYLLRGGTIQLFKRHLRMHRPCCVTGGGLTLASQTEAGAFLAGTFAGGGGNSSDVDLPDADSGKVYFLRKATRDKLFAAARRNHTRAVTDSGVFTQDGRDGVVVSA